jgi:hypothetical protein
MDDLKGILVVGELEKERLTTTTKELLGVSRELLDVAEGEVNLMLIGENLLACAEEGIVFGADKVYVLNSLLAQEFPCDFTLSYGTYRSWPRGGPKSCSTTVRLSMHRLRGDQVRCREKGICTCEASFWWKGYG